jgi:hypothetical protein
MGHEIARNHSMWREGAPTLPRCLAYDGGTTFFFAAFFLARLSVGAFFPPARGSDLRASAAK